MQSFLIDSTYIYHGNLLIQEKMTLKNVKCLFYIFQFS